MKLAVLCLLVLFSASALAAEEPDYPGLIRKTLRYLSVFPDNDLELANLAWYYMQTGQPEGALACYSRLAGQNPENDSAASGKLWALNSLYRYDVTLDESAELTRRFPENPDIFNHRGLARLRTYSPLRAKPDYSTALELSSPESPAAAIARDGLAWSYLVMGDYANALQAAGDQPSSVPLTVTPFLEKTRVAASLGLGFKDNGDSYYLAEAKVSHKTTSLSLSLDEYRIDGEYYRTISKLSLARQFQPLELTATGQYLRGRSEIVYPAWQAGLSAQGRVYTSTLQIKPLLTARYTYYQTFSISQADLGLKAGTDRFKLQFIYSGLHRDDLRIGHDAWDRAWSASAELRVWQGNYLSLHANGGELAWWTNPSGTIIDADKTNETTFGLGLYLPLGAAINLSLYQQLGIMDGNENHLTQGTLSLAF